MKSVLNSKIKLNIFINTVNFDFLYKKYYLYVR